MVEKNPTTKLCYRTTWERWQKVKAFALQQGRDGKAMNLHKALDDLIDKGIEVAENEKQD